VSHYCYGGDGGLSIRPMVSSSAGSLAGLPQKRRVWRNHPWSAGMMQKPGWAGHRLDLGRHQSDGYIKGITTAHDIWARRLARVCRVRVGGHDSGWRVPSNLHALSLPTGGRLVTSIAGLVHVIDAQLVRFQFVGAL